MAAARVRISSIYSAKRGKIPKFRCLQGLRPLQTPKFRLFSHWSEQLLSSIFFNKGYNRSRAKETVHPGSFCRRTPLALDGEAARAARQERLEQYRRTGRVVVISPDEDAPGLDNWSTGLLDEDPAPAPPSRKKRFLDRFLLIIEICAVIGFIFILFSGLNLIKELNQEVVSVLDQPTLTPTPLIKVVVLPSGHTPPNSPGGSRFNEAEIPEHLRRKCNPLASVILPTAGPEQAIRIQVPTIRVDAPVVQGDGWEQLKKGVGQHADTPNRVRRGNIVLSGA